MEEGPKTVSPDGKETIHRFISQDSVGAEKLLGLLVAKKPSAKPTPYHYHTEKEAFYLVLRGRAKVVIEDREYEVEPNTVVFLKPGEKHQVAEVLGDSEYVFLEVGAPSVDDRVLVKK